MATVHTTQAGDISLDVISEYSAFYGAASYPDVSDDVVLDHACTLGDQESVEFASLDCVGDGSGSLGCSGSCAITADVTGLEALDDTGANELTVTGDAETSPDQAWDCKGITNVTGDLTAGGEIYPVEIAVNVSASGDLTVDGTITGTCSDGPVGVAATGGPITAGAIVGIAATQAGVRAQWPAGIITATTVSGTCTGAGNGVDILDGGSITGDVTAQCGSGGRSVYIVSGTLTGAVAIAGELANAKIEMESEGAWDGAADLSPNASTDPGPANVVKDVAYSIEGAAKLGTFDEAARNTDPGATNVREETAYKIANVPKVGTMETGGLIRIHSSLGL